ncbi:hypothetical protein SSX86_026233 [Deinandra increscens subsp. villosa]|uniref:WD repeat-containing protein 76 n=1 Tax=Deinandra increscens subsp. villosa TaxID=3103831 RepID=A0AAP0CEH8_9ASTR
MATQRLTDYELKRLENIKRNEDLLASLNIKSKLFDLSVSAKRHRAEAAEVSRKTKPRSEAPIVVRKSLRQRGKAPDCAGLKDDGDNKCRVRASIDLGSMKSAPDQNIARVVPSRIHSVKFFPSEDLRMVIVGNRYGNLGFWNVDDSDGGGVYMCHPHPATISAILIHPFSLNKIGVLSGPNFEDEFIIDHYNDSRGVWGWDDSYIFVGSINRGVDVISTQQKRLVTTLESPYLTAILTHFDPHPFNPGMLAGATGGGQVYIWSYERRNGH